MPLSIVVDIDDNRTRSVDSALIVTRLVAYRPALLKQVTERTLQTDSVRDTR